MTRLPAIPLRHLAVLSFAALSLGACQTLQTAQPAATPAAATVAPAAAPQAAPAPASQMAAIPPQPVINDDPGQLLGLDRAGVTALLGEPNLVRRDAPAEIWQYVGSGCVFDVVLYARGQDYSVTYTEARDAAAALQAPRPCLNSLLRERQAAPVS